MPKYTVTDHSRTIIGCMTGTSLDGLDVAAVRVHGRGLDMRVEPMDAMSVLFGDWADVLRALARGEAMSTGRIAQLSRTLGEHHAQAVEQLIERVGPPDIVVLHGQTVYHAEDVSWQLIDPWPVAQVARCRVVSDLRGADIANGGRGAPITPIADWVLFRSPTETRAIVNLGGFCNMTTLPASGGTEMVRGRDVCACNHVLDELAREHLGEPFDESGRTAQRGCVHGDMSDALHTALMEQARSGLALGSSHEHAWEAAVTEAREIQTPDLLASAVDAIARTIMHVVTSPESDAAQAGTCTQQRILLAGGGVRNDALVNAITRHSSCPVDVCDSIGVPAMYREATAMAVLGVLCDDGVPITLQAVTGVASPAPIAGAWIHPQAHTREVEAVACEPTSPARDEKPNSAGELQSADLLNRSDLLTEQRNPRSAEMDTLSVEACVRLINAEDAGVSGAVARAVDAISAFIEAAERTMRVEQPAETQNNQGGRLIYLGAGTSGRLGVLDASECPPTFQTPHGLVVGVIAGGDAALRRSSESREDDPNGSHEALDALGVSQTDTILGITAGGTTPYVLGGLAYAAKRGATTGLLTCSPLDAPPTGVHHLIVVETGPEVLTGSTRMKAGTATKLVLNTISTTLMVRLGRVHGNLMVDLRATNTKLRDRAVRIVCELTDVSRPRALELLDVAGGEVKVAVVMHTLSVSRNEAHQRLTQARGRLREALHCPAHRGLRP